ncbi:MAG: PLP-dependent transferase [Desulfobulbales bacterium]|nr:PLP-dependent transferase [Desulfobulbales bacterium]
MTGFSTRAIHGAVLKRDVHGSLRAPVYDNVAFEFDSARDINLAFAGRKPAHTYSRITNPTVEDFEQRIRLASGGAAAVAVSSGMAAIANVILTLAGAGTNIVTSKHLFGNTLSLFEKTLKPWGLDIRYADMSDPDTVARAIDHNTRAVFLESITNPQLEVADFRPLSAITREKSVPLVVDNTVTTPYLFRSKEFGVNVEVLSSTKYITGGATSLGGVIIDNGNYDWRNSPRLKEWAVKMGPLAMLGALRREIYRNVGACLAPHHAYLQSLGLETMSLRIDRSCSNALELAEFLQQHDKVASVHYPGLPDSVYHENAKKQFRSRYGGILTFDLHDKDSCFKLMDALKLIKRATNVNDNKTLILHPASTIFCEYPDEVLSDIGVRHTMIRLSAGIEDIDDLRNDLETGLAKL